MKISKHLRKIQGICNSCSGVIDKTRIESDKATARIFCDKCIHNHDLLFRYKGDNKGDEEYKFLKISTNERHILFEVNLIN